MADTGDPDLGRDRSRRKSGRIFPSLDDILSFGQRDERSGSAYEDLIAGRLSPEAPRATSRALRGLLLMNALLFVALFATWFALSPITEMGRRHPEYLTAYILFLTVGVFALSAVYLYLAARTGE